MSDLKIREAGLRWLTLEEVAEVLALGLQRRRCRAAAKHHLSEREKRVRPVRSLIKQGQLMSLNGRVREDWLADYQHRAAIEAQLVSNRRQQQAQLPSQDEKRTGLAGRANGERRPVSLTKSVC